MSVWLGNAWQVLLLFLIPVGGGIPAGVLLAQKYSFAWQTTAVLYFISDVILAFLFEPLMLMFIALGKRSAFVSRLNEAMKQSFRKTTAQYGVKLGPMALIMVAFGVDPMTGRTAAVAAGHGFVSGWALAITGDMIYFALIMASTLWLKGILGDGTSAEIIILVLMFVGPAVVRKIRDAIRGTRPA